MYEVRAVGDDVADAIAKLPDELLAAFAELRVALEMSPRSVGRPYAPTNPSGSRTVLFGPGGRGLALFVVEDRARTVVWLWQVTVAPDVRD